MSVSSPKTRQLHLSERRRIGAAESAAAGTFISCIFAFIGADDTSRTAAGSGGAWASRLRERIARVGDVGRLSRVA